MSRRHTLAEVETALKTWLEAEIQHLEAFEKKKVASGH
jgi:hypothetical protein